MMSIGRILVCLISLTILGCSENAQQQGPTILAAASLQEALEEVADQWAKEGHARPRISFAGSPALARQVESGGNADIVILADEAWMDHLEDEGRLQNGTRKRLLGNRLVVISPGNVAAAQPGDDPDTIAVTLGKGLIAMGDPDAVPVGRYAKASLRHMGQWNSVEPRIIPTENVRAALALVERGEVDAGIVYASDALASGKVHTIAELPSDTHPTIHYPAALLASSDHHDADGFLSFLNSASATKIFQDHGFQKAPE